MKDKVLLACLDEVRGGVDECKELKQRLVALERKSLAVFALTAQQDPSILNCTSFCNKNTARTLLNFLAWRRRLVCSQKRPLLSKSFAFLTTIYRLHAWWKRTRLASLFFDDSSLSQLLHRLDQAQQQFSESFVDLRKAATDLMRVYEQVSDKDLPERNVAEKKQLATVISRMAKPSCNILFMGLGSSGKTTAINVLLQRDLLPTSHLHNTATLCEVRYQDGKRTEPIDVDAMPFGASEYVSQRVELSKDIAEQIRPLVERSPDQQQPRFSAVRIRCAAQLLKVCVDRSVVIPSFLFSLVWCSSTAQASTTTLSI